MPLQYEMCDKKYNQPPMYLNPWQIFTQGYFELLNLNLVGNCLEPIVKDLKFMTQGLMAESVTCSQLGMTNCAPNKIENR